ncbi:MAG: exosortase/archaeosortase family protein [Phycisphaerae bacterium]|nr:exosortase/archaeosortase family protein [Phycisphaerae bacterium]
MSVHTYIKIFILTSLITAIFSNEMKNLVRQWLDDSNWSHGILIPFFSLYFLHNNRDELLSIKPKTSYIGLMFLILALLFYPFNIVWLRYGYFNPLMIIAVMGSVVLFMGGWKVIKLTWLPIFFLIFAIPLPQRYYVAITMPMRNLAATVATALLNMVNGLQATASGVVIDVIYKGQKVEPSLNVAEACSGMRLLMAFVALGVAMAYLHKRPVWHRLVLLASTIPIAIFCNMVRVTITGFIYILIHPKYAQGIYHDMLGFSMLFLAFGIYGFLGWFMESLFEEEKQSVTEDVIIPRKNGENVNN